ncbi:MAG: clan AA aspartic protease [Planctomycetota bacterium]|nr:MAG: clan AA aspartic protease [Planctomycetota bacterium]
MMTGWIDADCQAIVPLAVKHRGSFAPDASIEFLIDTGFTGYLSIPSAWVDRFGLSVIDIQRGITADGRAVYFETVDVTILWHDEPRVIRAQVLEEPLIGTRLLRSNQATIRWESGSTFEIHR